MSLNKNRRLFLKALGITLCALILIEVGRSVALKRAVTSTETEAEVDLVQTRSAEDFFFLSSFKDLAEETALAEAESKVGVFIFFDMQGCPYCEFMKDNVLNRLEVQDFYNANFRNITIDIHAATEAADVDGIEMTEKKLAEKYGVNLTPTMLFLGVDGDEIYRKQGIIKTVPEFMIMGKEIVDFMQKE